MEIWIIINPILRTIFYIASFGSVGSLLYIFHFTRQLTKDQNFYCCRLSRKSALIGAISSLILILSIAGNLGGDLASAFDLVLLEIAVASRSGVSYLTAFTGFIAMLIALKINPKFRTIALLFGSAAVLFSFAISGHALTGGLLTQILLLIHLFCIAFWLGALLPLRWICLQDNKGNLGELAHHFGVIALAYVGALVITGLAYAYILLGEVSLIFSTNYGNILLVKVIFVSVLICYAAVNKFLVVPSLKEDLLRGTRKLKLSIQSEIILAFVILVISSYLTSSVSLPSGS